MTVRTLVLVTTLALPCLVAGCSKSSTTQASSESSSKSISSPFESSSNSSSPDDSQSAAYRRDVRDYTAAFAGSDGDVQAFQRDLGGIAEDHGVTDWELDQGTYFSIGRGIAMAGVSRERYRELAVALSSQDYAHLELLRAGYETHRPR